MSPTIAADQVKTIIFACEAGMGSSLMSVNSLKKKLKKANITDVTVVHKGLAKVARSKAPNAVVLAFNHFLNDPVFDKLVTALVEKTEIVSTDA